MCAISNKSNGINSKEKTKDPRVAYFSMEIAIANDIPTYSGGLGVLAGDTLRSCADLEIPMIGITLLSRKGYFSQSFDENSMQIESPIKWDIEKYLERLTIKVTVPIEDRQVKLSAWRYWIEGVNGYRLPVYFLDANIQGNNPSDIQLTDYLYGGDSAYRFKQEVILGIGGLRLIDTLGYNNIAKYHMNEGHAALLTIQLLKNENGDRDVVTSKCVFTTHTPVPAGHDCFSKSVVEKTLSEFITPEESAEIFANSELNMTFLGLRFSKYINGVTKKHGEISRSMFPGYPIASITNGIHSLFWTSEPFRRLYDKYLNGWRSDPFMLRYASSIPLNEILEAHTEAKRALIDRVNSMTNAGMEYDVFTLGFARRATAYKRATLLLHNPERLMKIAEKCGRIQIIFSGKAHPKDDEGKKGIQKIIRQLKQLGNNIEGVYLENYDMDLARMMISGVDVWLNTPQRPYEASGTSGMKASVNGVPHFSTLDGWWLEGHIEDATGWAIGPKDTPIDTKAEELDKQDATDLYSKLENSILPKFYKNKDEWSRIMQYSIFINASFFNTHRMVRQYVTSAYFD
jgi:glycogen phosphorylase